MKIFNTNRETFFWRQAKRNKQEINVCVHMICGGLLAVAVSSTALATPTLMSDPGGAKVYTGDHTVVEQTSSNTVEIDWKSFDTTANQTVTFFQPKATSIAINRIFGNDAGLGGATIFNGQLTANGRIILINQNGMVFGQTASINVGSLLATTAELVDGPKHSILEANFEGGKNYAKIINEGHITVSPGGFAVLAAPYVENAQNASIKVRWDNGLPDGHYLKPGNEAPIATGYQEQVDYITSSEEDGGLDENLTNNGQWEPTSEDWQGWEAYTDEETGKQLESHIELASTNKFDFFFDLRGDSLIYFHGSTAYLTEEDPLGVKNAGLLQADSGEVFLSAAMLGQLIQSNVNWPEEWSLDSKELVTVAGKIWLGGDIVVDKKEGHQEYPEDSLVKVNSALAGNTGDIQFDGVTISAVGGNNINVLINAGGDITNGDDAEGVALQSNITLHAENHKGRRAFANLEIHADNGAIDVHSNSTVNAISSNAMSKRATKAIAEANVDISGYGNVAVTGDINMQSSATLSKASADSLSKDADAQESFIIAVASATPGADSAAKAVAKGDITVSGRSIQFEGDIDQQVTATTLNNSLDADASGYASANAFDEFAAEFPFDFDEEIAIAETFGTQFKEAFGEEYPGVTASADLVTRANGNIRFNAFGDISQQGNINQQVHATSLDNYVSASSWADSKASATATTDQFLVEYGGPVFLLDGGEGGDIPIPPLGGSFTDTLANALPTSVASNRTLANGNIDINSRYGDVQISGENISQSVSATTRNTVTASATGYANANANSQWLDYYYTLAPAGVGQSKAYSDAFAIGDANNRTKADGSINVNAYGAIASNVNITQTVNADASGTQVHGNATAGATSVATGGATQDADAVASAESEGNSNAKANGLINFYAKQSIDHTGNIAQTVNATSATETSAWASANASATPYQLREEIGPDFNLVYVPNQRTERSSQSANKASAIAATHFGIGDSQQEVPQPTGGTINYLGDLNIAANASGQDTDAKAIGTILAPGDINYDGETNVTSNANSNGNDADANSTAALVMFAGANLPGSVAGGGYYGDSQIEGFNFRYGGNLVNPATLNKNGDVLVQADATATGRYADANAISIGVLSAGGEVNIDTDPVIVNANADAHRFAEVISDEPIGQESDIPNVRRIDGGEGGSATAIAALVTAAGVDSIEEGGLSQFGIDYETGDLTFTLNPEAGSPHDLNIIGDHEANATASADATYKEHALAANILFASGNIDVQGADPLASANGALAQGKITQFDTCFGGQNCFGGPGIGLFGGFGEEYFRIGNEYAQLVVLAGGSVNIRPKPDPIDVDSPTEVLFNEELFIEPNPGTPTGAPGDLPLRFAANGDMLVATGFNLTAPPSIEALNLEFEEAFAAAIESGADPSTLLSPTAAGAGSQSSLVSGQDSMTMTGPDFCDKLVAGACFGGTQGGENSQ